jgi:hypothetical protein
MVVFDFAYSIGFFHFSLAEMGRKSGENVDIILWLKYVLPCKMWELLVLKSLLFIYYSQS